MMTALGGDKMTMQSAAQQAVVVSWSTGRQLKIRIKSWEKFKSINMVKQKVVILVRLPLVDLTCFFKEFRPHFVQTDNRFVGFGKKAEFLDKTRQSDFKEFTPCTLARKLFLLRLNTCAWNVHRWIVAETTKNVQEFILLFFKLKHQSS